MRTTTQLLTTAVAGLLTCTAPVAGSDILPPPRPLPALGDDCVRISGVEFDRLVTLLKTERDALDADWKSYAKQRSSNKATSQEEQHELEDLLKKARDRIRDRDQESVVRVPVPKLEVPPQQKESITVKTDDSAQKPKTAVPPTVAPADNAPAGGVDPLNLGNTLLRLEKYADALASYRLVDLKTKAVEERAPIQFLMASCLLHLGKNEEAVELLREAANARGNDRAAGYAQWKLDWQRWQRDVLDRLEDIRRRRLAAERQP